MRSCGSGCPWPGDPTRCNPAVCHRVLSIAELDAAGDALGPEGRFIELEHGADGAGGRRRELSEVEGGIDLARGSDGVVEVEHVVACEDTQVIANSIAARDARLGDAAEAIACVVAGVA